MNQPSDKKKILITGAYGFVGTNLLKELCNDYQLIALDLESTSPPTPSPALPSVTGEGKEPYSDFFSWQDLDSIPWDTLDTIIHLAGKAHDTRNIADEKEYFEVNVGLTEKIAERFQNSTARKLICFSSVKAVADSFPEGFLTEETTPAPTTPYGRSKLAAEKILLQPATRNQQPATCNLQPATSNQQPATRNLLYLLRPCMIHGPGNKGNLNELVRFVKTGLPWPLGAFENQRSFTSIANLVFVIRQLIDKEIEPGIYQVADDEPLSTNELIRMIAYSMGKRARIMKLPPGLIRGLARLGDRLPFPLNSERLQKLTESYRVSNQKLKNALGIERMPVTAAEGMRNTLKTF
ncbi:MAG: NAD-dependent epimerase/dehydratase family protein [Bacteroidales bacterium]|jgi:nucleoside-diphosphate-sugar epimerase